MAGVLKLVNVGPDLGLPCCVVGGGFSASGTAGMQRYGDSVIPYGYRAGKLDDNAAYLCDLFVRTETMFVALEVADAELFSFEFRLRAGVDWAVLGAKLFGRVTRHPEGFFVGHRWFRPWDANQARRLLEPA
jgi:glutamate-1-semialdehyde aminotransferase